MSTLVRTDLGEDIKKSFAKLADMKPGSEQLNNDATNIAFGVLNEQRGFVDDRHDENGVFWERKEKKYRKLYSQLKKSL